MTSRFYLPGLACSLILVLAGPAAAQIYTWTDAQGNRVYSDRPHPDASRVDVGPTNTIAAPAPSSTTTSTSQPAQQDAAYRRLAIISPSNDESIRSNEGTLTLQVETDPPLSGSHLLRAEIDGQLSEHAVPGNGQTSQQLVLNNVDRGSHAIGVVVLNARGDILQRGSPIIVHLQRTSVNQPGRTGSNQAPRPNTPPRAPTPPAGGGQ